MVEVVLAAFVISPTLFDDWKLAKVVSGKKYGVEPDEFAGPIEKLGEFSGFYFVKPDFSLDEASPKKPSDPTSSHAAEAAKPVKDDGQALVATESSATPRR